MERAAVTQVLAALASQIDVTCANMLTQENTKRAAHAWKRDSVEKEVMIVDYGFALLRKMMLYNQKNLRLGWSVGDQSCQSSLILLVVHTRTKIRSILLQYQVQVDVCIHGV